MESALKCEEKTALADVDIGVRPVRMVKEIMDMDKWRISRAYHDILGFINGISTAIQGKKLTDDIYVSTTMKKLIGIFDNLQNLLDKTPPLEQPQRFGNKAYRSWSRKMNNDIVILLHKAIPIEKCKLVTELSYYLSESFGNAVRIDYGTGHELSFIFYMCSLFKGEILTERDSVAAGLTLFPAYLNFVRRLQLTYRMEPAGSQGVWALDDYQFIPFIWGSAQLAYKTPFDPSKFLDEEIISEYKNEYMFISCIDFISKVKTGHFAEHSNQLWSITAVPTWTKINSGLVKMYQKEILDKYPIIQHVTFGELMKFDPVKPGTLIPTAHLGYLPMQTSKINVVASDSITDDVTNTSDASVTSITSKSEEIPDNKMESENSN